MDFQIQLYLRDVCPIHILLSFNYQFVWAEKFY